MMILHVCKRGHVSSACVVRVHVMLCAWRYVGVMPGRKGQLARRGGTRNRGADASVRLYWRAVCLLLSLSAIICR